MVSLKEEKELESGILCIEGWIWMDIRKFYWLLSKSGGGVYDN